MILRWFQKAQEFQPSLLTGNEMKATCKNCRSFSSRLYAEVCRNKSTEAEIEADVTETDRFIENHQQKMMETLQAWKQGRHSEAMSFIRISKYVVTYTHIFACTSCNCGGLPYMYISCSIILVII
jgi:excinuclease UvrABC nuclease subunit